MDVQTFLVVMVTENLVVNLFFKVKVEGEGGRENGKRRCGDEYIPADYGEGASSATILLLEINNVLIISS